MCIIIDSIIQTLLGLDTPWWLQVLLAFAAMLPLALINASLFVWAAGNRALITDLFSKNSDKNQRPPYFPYKKAWRSLLSGGSETSADSADAASAAAFKPQFLWETAFFVFSLLSLTPIAWSVTHCNLPSPVSCALTDSSYGAYMAVSLLLAAAICALRCRPASCHAGSESAAHCATALKTTARAFTLFALLMLSLTCPVIINSSASLSDITAGQSFNCFYLSVFGLNIFPAAAGAIIYVFCFMNIANLIAKPEAPFGAVKTGAAAEPGEFTVSPLFKTALAAFLFSGTALFVNVFLGGSILPKCTYPIICNAGFIMLFYTDLWLGLGVFLIKAYSAALLFMHFCIYRDNAEIAEKLEVFAVKHMYTLAAVNIAAGFIFIFILKLYFGG
ncbi:hypothetical protein IJT93_01970 [bacterium]|nr:hypothetical protein [bacterium]